MKKKVKNDTDANPPRGDGEQARFEPIRRDFYFYQQKLQYQKTKINPLGPYTE